MRTGFGQIGFVENARVNVQMSGDGRRANVDFGIQFFFFGKIKSHHRCDTGKKKPDVWEEWLRSGASGGGCPVQGSVNSRNK